jgi:site-specific DNA-methyltransferase (adenine-specific)
VGKKIELYNENCLDTMKRIEDGTIDLMVTDIPYGTTACEWDILPNLAEMWLEWERILKPDATWVFTCSQPVTTDLIISRRGFFKYAWVWNKMKAGNIFLAEQQPMKIHEDVLVFQRGKATYNPLMVKRDVVKKSKNYGTGATMGGTKKREEKVYTYDEKYPSSIITFSNASQTGKIHPTQKPIDLFRYLIETYSNKGETVFDGYSGSGTCALACIEENRNFIGSELSTEYFNESMKRINLAQSQTKLF